MQLSHRPRASCSRPVRPEGLPCLGAPYLHPTFLPIPSHASIPSSNRLALYQCECYRAGDGDPSPLEDPQKGSQASQPTMRLNQPSPVYNQLPYQHSRLKPHPPHSLTHQASSLQPQPKAPARNNPAGHVASTATSIAQTNSKGDGCRAAAADPTNQADSPPPSRWARLFQALLAHIARGLYALAISFCLLALMLLKPRAVGAQAMQSQHIAPTTTTVSARRGSEVGSTHRRQVWSPEQVAKQLVAWLPAFLNQPSSSSLPASQHQQVSLAASSTAEAVSQPLTTCPRTRGRVFASMTAQALGSGLRADRPAGAATAASGASSPSSHTSSSIQDIQSCCPPLGTLAPPNVVVGAVADVADGDESAGEGAGSGASGFNTQPVPQQLSGTALLAAQEAAVTALFKSTQASVVNISGARAAGTFSTLDVSRVGPGQGSGFVWDEKGHVVTSYSSVRGASEVKVTLSDASSFTAKLVGHDAGKDLAVLRLSMPKARLKELVPVKLAAGTGPLAVGQSVWALGNASGLDHTLTQGVISGLGRELPGGGPYPLKGLIQTDAACGHQAGGVLVNIQGRMIGMVVGPGQAGGRSAGYALGYALPVDVIKGLVTQILTLGKSSRPTLGVTLAPPQVLAAQGVDGVLVLEVPPGSPAAAAGIRHTHRDIFGDVILGDVIVGIEGGSVRTAGDLYAALDARKAGDRVRVDVLRDGKATSLTVVLGERGQAGALEE